MPEKLSNLDGTRASVASAVPRPAPDVVARRLGDSAVLVRLTTNRIYELNVTAARIWELLDRGWTRDALVDHLSEEFKVAAPIIARDVDALLGMLHAEGLTVQG